VWVAILALSAALLSLSFGVYLWLELRQKVSAQDIVGKLSQSSEELSKTYARSIKEIETEWDNMYAKFASLAGRMDRKKALTPQAPEVEESPRSRADILRKRRV